MRLSEQVKPISQIKANAAEILKGIARDRRPVVITQNGEATAVLQDIASFEETQETIALLKLIAMGERDIAAGRTIDADTFLAELRSPKP